MGDMAIVTEGLTKRFGKETVVDGLDLQIPSGCVCGFLGRNGAGKSTTIKMLINLLEPNQGQARVLGLDPQKEDLAVKRQVGYVSDTPVMYG